MTRDDTCTLILALGGKEYTNNAKPVGTRSFYMAQLEDAPNCACNDRPPSVHVNVYDNVRHPSTGEVFPGGVDFDVFGEAGDGRWIEASIYSVKREEVEEVYPSAKAAARAVWVAFVEAMKPREVLSPRRQG
jgi:hypothetical protein